jgi:aconitate hydratase
MAHNLFNTLQSFDDGSGRDAKFYSLPQLETEGIAQVSRLPISLRVVLESVLRNYDETKVEAEDVRALANWRPVHERTAEVPFTVARVLLQDFTGVPLLVDLAAMRSEVARRGADPLLVEPLVPVDLVIDHSVQVDFASTPEAFRLNMETEFRRNRQRYEFLKWGQNAFKGFRVVPPGLGICHQVNLEYLAQGVLAKPITENETLYYPDTLVGTDSHTTMVNGLGIVGWGVGGIEAEAAMLGQPVYFLTPDVVGVLMSGRLREGVTATDLVLHITEMLRHAKVVGKFVEFHGEGAASLPATDRATIANMAPEYGATLGFFPVDEKTCEYLLATGRSEEQTELVRRYYTSQQMFGIPRAGECDYSLVIELNLGDVAPSVAGPRRPQDRIDLPKLKNRFRELLSKPSEENGYGLPQSEADRIFTTTVGLREEDVRRMASEGVALAGGGEQSPETAPHGAGPTSETNTSLTTEFEMMNNRPTPNRVKKLLSLTCIEEELPREFRPGTADMKHGDVAIAAITSCTNTSNPSVMLAAGLLAKKAVEFGLSVKPYVKTSLAPGSRVVTGYLEKTGLQPYLNQLGFNLVGYGCTTCIGNSGPLDPNLEEAINSHGLVLASVLSGNRNFEARVHGSLKANFLMSPPLVVAFALAGTVRINMEREPLGLAHDGREVYLRDIWPSVQEVGELMREAFDAEAYRRFYGDFADQNPMWNEIPSSAGALNEWNSESTYIREPPYFEQSKGHESLVHDVRGARALAIFGDSVTTDHISPAGAIQPQSPAGLYLAGLGVKVEDFNSYGSRRGNHHVMVRGTFANVRIKNLIAHGTEGGVTTHQPSGKRMTIYDAAVRYAAEGVPLVVFAGEDYGAGSSRDWAAKGTRLLGVRAVIATSFERIHRSNLVGMGVLPLQFEDDMSAQKLRLDGTENFDLLGIGNGLRPRGSASLVITRAGGETLEVPLIVRVDTPVEVDYFTNGGILPFVLKNLLVGAHDITNEQSKGYGGPASRRAATE